MKSFKKILLLFIAAFLLVLPLSLKVVNAEEGKKVKVYIFEAGGCPFCEQEKEYLQSLESYGKKFEIVVKQLYVDHVDWAPGADYELGKNVATAFKEVGFEQAAYNATPFVVISDLYAAATYSENLEQYINKAYEEGDKDVVGCYANGGLSCLQGATPLKSKDEGISPDTWCLIIMGVFVVGTVVFVILSRRSTKEEYEFKMERYADKNRYQEEDDDEEETLVDEEEVEEPKKTEKTEKNTKKTANKSNSTKTNKTSKSKSKKTNKKSK